MGRRPWWVVVGDQATEDAVGAGVALLVVGLGIWIAARQIAPEAEWVGTGIVLMLSPLWFLIVYAMLVATAPLWFRLHERFGELVPVWMVGIAVVVDVLRFRYAWRHRVGQHAHRLGTAASARLPLRAVDARRRDGSRGRSRRRGFFALFGLTNMGLYPRSMVGVPGEELSNMAPPTLAIAALTIFQVGVLLARAQPDHRVGAVTPARASSTFAARNSMRIFLWHAPGFAIAYGCGGSPSCPGQSPDLDGAWWAWRPLWFLLPVLPTAILASTIGTLTIRARRRSPTALAT